ncbi:MAG TPA: hypothetical protein VK835_00820 [Bacteroidia bacterium]|jgi:hypothetical protein|nr:hypothetical protein [Bacteroidia bacterium]
MTNKLSVLKKIFYAALLIAVLVDVCFSFKQYSRFPLDGDMAGGIVPDSDVQKILNDPLGFNVLLKKDLHSNPNRFFAHWSVYKYFRAAPAFLQNFTSPIDSVYLSCALAKVITQVLLILLLAYCTSLHTKTSSKDILVAVALITPLFQTEGYNRVIGIIDWSAAYTFFYALPLALTVIFFIPFYNTYFLNKKSSFNYITHILLIPLAIFISLNGPLIPGVTILLCPITLIYYWHTLYKKTEGNGVIKQMYTAAAAIPKPLLFYFTLLSFLSLYSLYLGSFNPLNKDFDLPIYERYIRLAQGVKNLFTETTAFSFIILMILLNISLIGWKYKKEPDFNKIISITKCFVVFSVLYILLLPLGGTRIYRPFIIRADTIMPVTLGAFFLFGVTALFLLKKTTGFYKLIYFAVTFAFLFHYMDEDNSLFHNNNAEKAALNIIAKSPDKIVEIPSDVTVLSWVKITDYTQSDLNASLIQCWGITKEKKLYFQK